MASCVFGVALIFMLRLSDAAQDFKKVSACPRDADSWTLAANAKICQGDTPDYLCAAIENEPGILGEICTKYGLTPAKKCAVLNQQTKNLDSVDCKAPSGCPEDPYNPSELWKHQICYRDFYGTTTTIAVTIETTANPLMGSPSSDEGGSGTGAAVAVIVVLLIICITVVVLVVLYNRHQGFKKRMQPHIRVVTSLFGWGSQQGEDVENQKDEGGENENPEHQSLLEDDESQKIKEESQKKKEVEKPVYAFVGKKRQKKDLDVIKKNGENETNHWDEEKKISKLKELLKYPIHILKRELDVRDLKEKIVIYSKSIKEHFTAPLISDLQSVQSLDDYSRLDMTVVFTLLQNCCENIKPPRKGWDYEPPSDEITTGADIERIRLMWNKYCDDDLQCPQLDDVFNRMKDKFGTVVVHGDDGERKSNKEEEGFEDIRDKVSCIKLNPDCVIEKGIIITDNITSAIRHLQTRNVVILKGAIGCGKTHALKAIKNYFEEKEWNTKLMNQNLRLEDLKTDNGKTVLLCDNFGGSFGFHYFFTKGFIEKFEEILGNLDSGSTGNTKVVIGIHQHVFEEVKKTHSVSLNFLQNKNCTIEMDKLTEAETFMIFKEQQKKGHCIAEPGCWFRKIDFSSVLSKLSTSPGHIGSPFLSLMYCHHHNLFSDDDFIKNPVHCLIKHFKGIREKHPTAYVCLVYVMCVQTHSLDTAVMPWAGIIDAYVTNKAIEDTIHQNPGYLHTEKRKTTLMHDILTIALLKSASEVQEIFHPVLQNCKTDILLELLRPGKETQSEFYTVLAGSRKNEKFSNCEKRLVHNITKICGKQWEHMNHPLQSEELFKEKYERYLNKSPKMK